MENLMKNEGMHPGSNQGGNIQWKALRSKIIRQ